MRWKRAWVDWETPADYLCEQVCLTKNHTLDPLNFFGWWILGVKSIITKINEQNVKGKWEIERRLSKAITLRITNLWWNVWKNKVSKVKMGEQRNKLERHKNDAEWKANRNMNQRQVHRLGQNLFRIAILLLIFCFYALVAASIAVRFAGVVALQAWTWEVPIFCSWHCIIACWISTCESQIGSYWMKYHFWILYHFWFFVGVMVKTLCTFLINKEETEIKKPC